MRFMKMKATGKVKAVNDLYADRILSQGTGIETEKPEEPVKAEQEKPAETSAEPPMGAEAEAKAETAEKKTAKKTANTANRTANKEAEG